MTRRSRALGPMLYLGLLLLTFGGLGSRAGAQEGAEPTARRAAPMDEQAAASDDGRESARERRKWRREEREREAKSAAGAAQTEAPVAADGAAATPVSAAAGADLEAGEPLEAQVDLASWLTKDGLEPASLVSLGTLDLAQAPPEQLQGLDARLTQMHEALQGSEQCETIRGASRVPFRSWVWREHQREIFTGMALFIFSLIVGFAWESKAMRTLLPIVPFAACIYLGYEVSAQTNLLMDSVTRGLRACSTPLDEGASEKPKVVHRHFEQVTRMNTVIEGAYERDDRLMARVMREYRM